MVSMRQQTASDIITSVVFIKTLFPAAGKINAGTWVALAAG